jgi:hypothetical protein
MIRRSPGAGGPLPVADEGWAEPGTGSSLPLPHPAKIDRETRRKMNQIEKGILILGKDPSDFIFDGLVKSARMPFSVISAKAGIRLFQRPLDPGLRRGDGSNSFLRNHHFWEVFIKPYPKAFPFSR